MRMAGTFKIPPSAGTAVHAFGRIIPTVLNKPTAYRAVANANGANQLAIIIPCHRIISSDGSLGGYGGGIAVKQWLLEHERRHQST